MCQCFNVLMCQCANVLIGCAVYMLRYGMLRCVYAAQYIRYTIMPHGH